MPYVSSFERSAIEKGVQQGVQQGMQTGEATALKRLLKGRFGALQTSVTRAIDSAPLSQIEAWFDRAITAPSLADVFAQTTPPPH